MVYPKCEECGKILDDWQGNVMVDKKYYPDKIKELVIICKECTKRLDEEKEGRKLWHNIWELRWVKDNYFHLQENVFKEKIIGQAKH
ncbi:hypothetical protein D2962_06085 [Biomaibacter acetigenes]|uniref:Uncharacterized protein n=1 Tax=Biomaibacter acetigenes TaxID=2316383 RepID=A0A3G2R3Z9_9FIRM|nr:hypothetical protein [Biomaibacter acetigenes]AYO30244.1 hypothetical protein D2962_06085 [Biomaibacter acetigenes]